jgi:voltage-gated potassium channel
MTRAAARRPRLRGSARLGTQIALVVAVYYLVPFGEPVTASGLWARLAGTAAVLAVLALVSWRLGRHLRHEMRGPAEAVRVDVLVLAVVAGLVVFAAADLVVARLGPGQFVGLETKTDALYFALTTVTTVGYGDVHATGQLARSLVIVQMLFDAVVLAAAAHTAVLAVQSRR